MKTTRPAISMLIWTYNRAHLVERSIESVLNQTYRNFELIIINNGSEDNTKEVLGKYSRNEKVRVFHLEKNIGALGGMNYALDQIGGEWFTTLGDDDEIVENAFELLMSPTEIDPEINAVTANAVSTSTDKFAGMGLEKDQYVPIDLMVGKVSGEFFGITKTELLGDLRIREDLPGEANVFWYQIDAKAKRYYIHQGLKIWNTDHDVTVSQKIDKSEATQKAVIYQKLLEETAYWELLKKYNLKQYQARCFRGFLFLSIKGATEKANIYKKMLNQTKVDFKYRMLLQISSTLPMNFINKLYLLRNNSNLFKSFASPFIKNYSRIG